MRHTKREVAIVHEETVRKFQKELNSGAISLVLLSLIAKRGQPMYGYEIAKSLFATGGDLPMNESAIYPVLRSLERQKLLQSTTQRSETGPPRRYYQITDSGRQALAAWRLAWTETKSFVEQFLEMKDGSDCQPEVPTPTGP